ncbi:MAG: hypothetical protein PHE59_04810 [Patescibacteria group bacterium]|nr:hypothetical protein [Patescibacteria group bacterium]
MAKKKCRPCLGVNLKQQLLSIVKGQAMRLTVEEVPECEDPNGADFCLIKARQPSQYQQFVSKCMKEKNIHGRDAAAPAMKECAAAWKRVKSQQSPQ